MRPVFWLLLGSILWSSCAVFQGKNARFTQHLEADIKHSPVFAHSNTGFTLLDPTTGKTLADVRGDHYFTPASNIKILTLATCLDLLGDSVPAMRYFVADTFLVFRGVADPTFLHPYFQDFRRSVDFLTRSKYKLLLRETSLLEPRFGPGWAWDDYTEAYQPEKTIFPIYGNTLKISGIAEGRGFQVQPPFFRTVVEYPSYYYHYDPIKPDIGRREGDNLVGMRRLPKLGEEIVIPFKQPYWQGMLRDTLQVAEIDVARNYFDFSEAWPWKTLYSTPLDTVLRRMMHQSDNFIAEQLLLVCAGERFDQFWQDTLIQWMLENKWADMPQKPRWVDGSGLSRYNLATPQSLAFLLRKMWLDYEDHSRLLKLFPAGGVGGTLQDWYRGPAGKPYVFAKTGGMSGVHCLSGYLVCKSGKVLIFSFMHNNFIGSNRPWKAEMERFLLEIYEQY